MEYIGLQDYKKYNYNNLLKKLNKIKENNTD